MDEKISIKGIEKARVLAALFNRSFQQGVGIFIPAGSEQLSLENAQRIIDSRLQNGADMVSARKTGPLYFDYVLGRVLKVDLNGDEFDPYLYDRDNGPGAAAKVIEKLRGEVT